MLSLGGYLCHNRAMYFVMAVERMSIEKIGIACQKLQNSGGMEQYVLDLINGFADLGLKPTCFARKFDVSLPEWAKVSPVHFNTTWVPRKFREHLFSYLLSQSQKKMDSGPLISVARNNCSDVAICGGTHLGFLESVKKKPKIRDHLQVKLERQFYQNAQVIIAHSQLMAEELQQFYQVPPHKIKVLYPPVDASRFYPVVSKEALKKSLNLPLDKKVFLFPSSNHTRKGYELLEAYFNTSDLPVHLAVIGRPLPRKVKNAAYYGYQLEIAPFYQAADFTIMASTYEPFGLVAVESILSGTPIIISNKLGASEIIDDAAKVTFEPNNLADFDRAFRQILVSNHCLKGQASSFIQYDFSLKTHCQKILDFIKETEGF